MPAKQLICRLTTAAVLCSLSTFLQLSSQAQLKPKSREGGGEGKSLRTEKSSIQFGCDSSSGKTTLYAKSSQVLLPLLSEGTYFDTPSGIRQQRCEEIASRFQLAYNQGNLRYLVIQGREICASRAEDCDLVLLPFRTGRELSDIVSQVLVSLNSKIEWKVPLLIPMLNITFGIVPNSSAFPYEEIRRINIEKTLISLIVGEGASIENGRIKLGETFLSREELEKKILQYRKIGDYRNEAATLLNLGEIYARLKQADKSEGAYNRALEIYRKIGDRAGEGDVLRQLGNLYTNSLQVLQNEHADLSKNSIRNANIGNASSANGISNTLILVPETITGSVREGNRLSDSGGIMPPPDMGAPSVITGGGSRTGAGSSSSTFTTQSSKTPAGGSPDEQKDSAVIIPALAPRKVPSDVSYTKILELRQQALNIYRGQGNQLKQSEILNDIGLTYQDMGQYPKALQSYQTALNLSQSVQQRENHLEYIAVRSSALNNVGEIYRKQGAYSLALDFYSQSLSVIEGLKRNSSVNTIPSRDSRIGESKVLGQDVVRLQTTKGAVLNNIGLVHSELGQDSLAISFYTEALKLRRASNDLRGEGTTLHNFGFAYNQLQRNDKAIEFYQNALSIRQNIGDLHGEAITRNNLGLAYNEQQKYPEALEQLQSALKIFEALNDRGNIGNTLDSVGTVYKSLKQYPKALDSYQKAIQILQDAEDRTVLGIARTNLGDLYKQMGDKPRAISAYRQAIDENIETILADLKGEELQAAFSDKHADTYARLIGLLWDAGQVEDAFNYVERAKARAFLNQMRGRPANLKAGTGTALLNQEQAIRAELTDLNTQITTLSSRVSNAEDKQTIAHLKSKLNTRQQDYAQLLQQINRQNLETADLVSVNPAKLSNIRQLLPQDTTLVEYFVTDTRTLAFLVTRNGIKGVSLEVGRAPLEETIKALYEYDFATLQDSHPANLKQLHQWLIQPLKSQLSTPKLIVVPHSILHYLPFSALTNGQKFLIDDYALSILPNASVMRFLAKKHKPGRDKLMAFGNPTLDLFYAGQEAQVIAAMYDTQALLGTQVTKTELLSRSSKAGILHLATHGEFNATNPLFSALLLSPSKNGDSRLEVHEIYNMNLAEVTNLVVLSACQTQVGQLSRGDEWIGLNRAFLYAGSPNVLASLWNIDDQATQKLMQKFYSYIRQGVGKAEALQKAQREIRTEYAHPYYWAAFVLTGSGL